MKKCSTCKTEKDESDFDAKESAKDGLDPRCKDCKAVYHKKPKTAAMELVEAPRVNFNGKTQAEVLKMAIDLRMAYYRDGAIESIFDLAMMPVSKSTLTMSIKLQAARLLAGPLPGDQSAKPGEAIQTYDNLLQSLNDAYHKNAPRIKSVRNTTVTFEEEPKAISADP